MRKPRVKGSLLTWAEVSGGTVSTLLPSPHLSQALPHTARLSTASPSRSLPEDYPRQPSANRTRVSAGILQLASNWAQLQSVLCTASQRLQVDWTPVLPLLTANQNTLYWFWRLKRKKKRASVGKDTEKVEGLCTASGNVKWGSHCGKQYGDTSVGQANHYQVMWQSHFWVCTPKWK